MVALVVYWDIHADYVFTLGGAKRWLSAFLFTLEAFAGTDLLMIGEPKIAHGYNIQHEEYPSLDSVLAAYPEMKIVACVGTHPENIEPQALKDYIHPSGDVLYIIGGDYSEVEFEKLVGREVDYVNIENHTNSSYLWSHTVAAIMLRDRYVKSL